VRTLGKQWTYEVRVIAGHELITQGPCAVVRNPIYLGMFGLMVTTGLAYTTWWALLAAVIIFLSGNRIRIRSEEKLPAKLLGYSSMSMPVVFLHSSPATFNYFPRYSCSEIIRFITWFMLTLG
jgi:hypothetical protein